MNKTERKNCVILLFVLKVRGNECALRYVNKRMQERAVHVHHSHNCFRQASGSGQSDQVLSRRQRPRFIRIVETHRLDGELF